MCVCTHVLSENNVLDAQSACIHQGSHISAVCVCLVLQQARAEQEEEFISNTLFKKIQALQKEKETLAVNYEKEEEFLTNELSRKLMQVRLWHKGIRSE